MADKTEKDQIFEEAKEKFDVKLDRRLKLSELQDQLARLEDEKENPVAAPKIRTPKTLRNIFTGNEFSYDPIFGNNPDLEVIEWETEDGDS